MRHRQGSGHHLFQEDSYEVYKIGETQAITIFSTQPNLFKESAQSDGFYKITLGADNKVSSVDLFMGAYGDGHTAAGVASQVVDELNWSRGYIKDYKGGSLVLTQEDKTSTFADYIASGAKFFDVTMTIWADGANTTTRTSITANESQAVTAGDRVIVGYKDGVAAYVYALKTVTDGQETPTEAASLILVNNAAKQVQATYKTGSKAFDIKVVYYYRLAGTSNWSVMDTGSNHSYAAGSAAQTFDARTVPGNATPANYEVYAAAASTAAATLDTVVATSGIVTILA